VYYFVGGKTKIFASDMQKKSSKSSREGDTSKGMDTGAKEKKSSQDFNLQ